MLEEGMKAEKLTKDILACIDSDNELKNRVYGYIEAREKADEELLDFCMDVAERAKSGTLIKKDLATVESKGK